MKKIRYRSLDSIGYHPLELPRLTLETAGFWLAPARGHLARARRARASTRGRRSRGVRNLFVQLLPLMAMCDPFDLGGMIDSSNLGRPGMFVFDRYPGRPRLRRAGLGAARRTGRAASLAHLEGCPCGDGCPACVGSPIYRPAQQQDLDAMKNAREIPGKAAARALLERWLPTRLSCVRAHGA